MRIHVFALAVVLIAGLMVNLSPSPGAAAPGVTPTFQATPRVGDVTLDGRLDEPAWRKAPEWNDFRFLPAGWQHDTTQPLAQTHWRLLVDSDALYLGIRCDEASMGKLADQPVGPLDSVFARDVVEIFMSPNGSQTEYYQLAVSASNDHYAGYQTKWVDTLRPYEAVWQTAIGKGADYWVVEACIPLRAFYLTPSAEFQDTWLFNVARERKPVGQLTTWSNIPVLGFHYPEYFNHLSGMPRKPAKYDLSISNVAVNVPYAGEGPVEGQMVVSTVASPATAGKYMLSVWDADRPLVERRPVTLTADQTVLPLGAVQFPAPGRVRLRVALSSEAGELRHESHFALKVTRPEAMVVKVTSPFYANCIFPDEDIRQIEGVVDMHLPPQMLDGAELTAQLFEADQPLGQPFRSPLREGLGARFRLDATTLRPGTYALRCTVAVGAREVASRALTLRKLPFPKGSYLRIDRGLNVVENGRPIFVRTWYGAGAFANSAAIMRNLHHPVSPYLNVWSGFIGMQVLHLAEGKDDYSQDKMPSDEVLAAYKAEIDRVKDDPATRWYYLADEPELHSESPVYLRHLYEWIKENDPYHPVLIISNATDTYANCCDIIGCESYNAPTINPAGERKAMNLKGPRRDIQNAFLAGDRRVAVWGVPGAYWEGSQVSPSFPEIYCTTMNTVAAGVKGLIPFLYGSSFTSLDLRLGMEYIWETLACLDPYLLDPAENSAVTVAAPDSGATVLAKRTTTGDVLLLAVNVLNRPLKATITSEALEGLIKLYGLRENTTATVKNGSVTLDFDPYDVRILVSPEPHGLNGKGAQTVDAFKTDLARAKAQLAAPGNLLWGRTDLTWTASPNLGFAHWSMNDGLTDALGFKANSYSMPQWVALETPRGRPVTFSRARVFSDTVADFELQVWEDEGWQTVARSAGNRLLPVGLDLEHPVTAEKLRVLMTKLRPEDARQLTPGGWGGGTAELYEIELY